jgi:hypothetical protein
MKPQVDGHGHKSGRDDQSAGAHNRTLLLFFLPVAHPPLQQLWLVLEKMVHGNEHRQDEDGPVKPPLPVMKGAGQEKKEDGNDNGSQTKPHHRLSFQPLVSLPVEFSHLLDCA